MNITTESGLASGAIYDALHLCGARKAGCEKLYTLNSGISVESRPATH